MVQYSYKFKTFLRTLTKNARRKQRVLRFQARQEKIDTEKDTGAAQDHKEIFKVAMTSHVQ